MPGYQVYPDIPAHTFARNNKTINSKYKNITLLKYWILVIYFKIKVVYFKITHPQSCRFDYWTSCRLWCVKLVYIFKSSLFIKFVFLGICLVNKPSKKWSWENSRASQIHGKLFSFDRDGKNPLHHRNSRYTKYSLYLYTA